MDTLRNRSKIWQKLQLFLIFVVGMSLTIAAQNDSFEKKRNNRHKRFEASKIAYITTRLDLSPEESQKFWPVFNLFTKQQQEIKKSLHESFDRDKMTEEEARQFIEKSLQMHEKQLLERKKLNKELSKFLSWKKIAKLQLIDREFKRNILEDVRKKYKRRG